MTRNGKIARLPVAIRTLLNQRLRNGETGKQLVEWLNGLPVAREVMQAEFAGRPVNEQNLSEWKQGGYEDWLRHQETCAWVRTLVEESADLEEEAGDDSVADWFSAPLAVALGRCLQKVAVGAADDAEQRKVLVAMAREISQLRRQDHEAERLRLKRERWNAEQRQKEEAELDRLRRAAEFSQMRAEVLVEMLKDQYEAKTKDGSLSADEKQRCEEIFSEVEAWRGERRAGSARVFHHGSDRAGSNPIELNQTKGSQRESPAPPETKP